MLPAPLTSALGTLALLLVVLLGLALRVDRYGQAEHARPAPALVVLGARILPDGTASPALQARVRKAVALYRAGQAPLLVFSGGVGTYGRAEAEVARELAVAAGVPEAACAVEAESHSTAQNAAFTARLLRERGLARAIVVSEPYHLLRARELFRREGIEAHPSPASDSPRNQELPSRAYWTLREAVALLAHPGLLWGALRD